MLACYADEGLRTVLVTCTGGEVGEISDSTLAMADTLAEVRRKELERACEILRVGRLHLLGYRDSGMMGTPDNAHSSSFYQASLEEATARLVALVRRERPQVFVTYDERGFYGHPDQIRAHQITVAAFWVTLLDRKSPRLGLGARVKRQVRDLRSTGAGTGWRRPVHTRVEPSAGRSTAQIDRTRR